jgi:signal transduction histidine kinase
VSVERIESPKTKVLLVDDHEDNLVVLETILQSDELELLTARSGREALEILLVSDVAVALVDVQMPEMDGFELAQLMQGTERTRQIPILFVTASAHTRQRVFNGYAVGAVDFMFKPVDAQILRSKVDVFVQLYRQKQQIADQLRKQREMLRLNEILSAAIAHDLRNPLQTIAGGAMLIQKHINDEAIVRSSAERIQSGCARMTHLITDLLDFSNVRLTGTLPAHAMAVNLSEVAKKVVAEHQLADSSARFDVRTTGDLNGTLDESRMAQVFSNLIGNALAHGDRSEPVTMLLDGSNPNEIAFSIQNKGEIPAAMMPDLFNPFRSSGNRSAGSSGLGLGLYIVEQVVKIHGGRVSVHSGDGATRFDLRVPRHAKLPMAKEHSTA